MPELDLTKPCQTEPGGVIVHISCGCSTKGTICWRAKLSDDSNMLNTFWTDDEGKPFVAGFPRVVNVPEPPRTFDLEKALRMSKWMKPGTVVAENVHGGKYVSVMQVSDDLILAVADGYYGQFPLSGSWNSSAYLVNSHLPEPPFVERWVAISADGCTWRYNRQNEAEACVQSLQVGNNFFGKSKVIIYQESEVK